MGHTSKKEMKSRYEIMLRVGYCKLQLLLTGKDRVAYSVGKYGLTCEYYDMGNGVCISTGNSPTGAPIDAKLIGAYERMAFVRLRDGGEDLEGLRQDFVKDILRGAQ